MRFIQFVWNKANAPFRLNRFETDLYRDPTSGKLRLIKTDYTLDVPDVILVLFMLIFACMYYGVLSVPVTWLLANQITLRHWPAIIVLAVNSTYRFVLKYQERAASLVDWGEPVGRENRFRWVIAVLVGFLAGTSSGVLADWLIGRGQFTAQGLGFAALLGLAEMVWNGKRIGGGALYDEVETPEVTVSKAEITVLEE
ncbi:MAG: hypothetical protein KDA29_04400 [Phycisphaerales bacterium]|nr:hypothetical protein [Phycisphaerales bacterium]